MTIIKKLIPDEWEILKQFRLTALETDGSTFDTSLAETLSDTEAQWRSKISGASKVVLVAYDGAMPIGMIRAYWNISERRGHVAYIRGLYVIKEYRGRGFGKKLMDAVIGEIRKVGEIKKIQLEVITGLKEAVGLYESLGFKIAGVLYRELFIDGVYYDKYIMELLF